MNNFSPAQKEVKKYFHSENIPAEIKQLRQWVLWNAKKLPLTVQKTAASSSDPKTWNTFDACKTALDSQFLWKSFVGVGFVFADSGYVGIDIDDAFPLSEPVQELITKFSSYTEISQSGNGLHIIIKGVKPRSECNFTYKGKRIEVYAVGRYFAMTGNLFRADNAIYERQTALDELFAEAFPETAAIPEPKPFPRQSKVQPLADEDYFINAVLQVLQEDGRGMFDDYQNDATKQDFLRLGFALKAKNLPFEALDAIVCGSQNYNQEENRAYYENLKPKYVNFGTAYEYAKRANPDKLKELLRAGAKARREQRQAKQQAEKNINLTLSPGQYLSDLPLSAALARSHSVAIYAGTGTGKTHFALNALPKMFPDSNILIVEPTRILAEQKVKDAHSLPFDLVYKGVKFSGYRLQIGTYDSIAKIPDEWLMKAVVVIDEAHQMTICMGYRRPAIQNLKEKTALCQKRIYMTGTPIPFGEGYTPDSVINIQSPSHAIPIEFLEVTDKSKGIEHLHKKGGTTLVYCRSRSRCKRLKAYFRKKGYKTGEINSKTDETELHKNLIHENTIDKALDFVFVTSYPSEGVDIIEHNINQIIVADFCPAWMLKQLSARTRNAQIEKITIMVTPTDKTPCKPFSPDDAERLRKTYYDVAAGIAAIKNAQIQSGRYDKTVQKVRKDLAGQIENAVRKVEKPLAGCSESFSFEVDPDYIEFLVYLEYEKAFRGNREYFIQELSRVGFNVNETVNKLTDTKTVIEKDLSKRVNEEIREEEQQEFEQDLQDAAQMEEPELYQQYEEETTAKTRLRLLAQELQDRILATKILQVIGRNTGKFNQALKQSRFRSYLKGKQKSVTIEKLRRIAKVGEMFSSEEIYDLMKPVYDSDPHLVYVSEGLRKTRQQFTPDKAVTAFQIIFDIERTTRRDSGKKDNVYRITSCNPLAKFEAVELRSELVLTHICPDNIKQFNDRFESETRIEHSQLDLEKQPLTAFMSHELTEYAETQLKTFGEVF